MTALDGRLQAAADFVTPEGFVVDVGADHGYLPVYLVEQGRARQALATDVNPQPLACARENIAAAGLEGKIRTQLADGLKGVDLTGATDIIIAGMGGMLIAEILEKRLSELDGLNLILQPMTQAPYLRRWLWSNGFDILEETPAQAAGKMYTVLRARFTGNIRECGELFAHVGRIPDALKIPEKREAAQKYLCHLAGKLDVIAMGMAQSGRDRESAERYRRLAEAVRNMEEGTK